MNKNTALKKLLISAMMTAISYLLPFVSGMIPHIGNMLCPMHIPVMLTGYICGAPYGLAVGFIAPLLRSFTLGIPVMFPKAVCMAFELATYGLLTGILYRVFPQKKIFIYTTLIISMLSGRVIWGIGRSVCAKITGEPFGIPAFIAGGFTTALPGIILQLILIPVLIIAFENSGLKQKLN